jgi:putative membrane protein
MMDYYNGYGGYGMMGGWGVLGLVFNLLVLAAVIIGVILLVRYLAGTGSSGNTHAALDTLKERYAKGEISKKEFEEIKKDISKS